MIKFLLYLILIALCWPLALIAGAVWILLALMRLVVFFAGWMVKPPPGHRANLRTDVS